MKTIGLIGGTGWISTIEYYRLINDETNKQLGGLNAAKIILYSFNYADIDHLNKQGNLAGVGEMAIEKAMLLEKAGADCILLCANTLHQYADSVIEKINIPLIHIADATAKTINSKGIKKAALLGTRYTMEMDFYTKRLNSAGIETLVPNKEDIEFIHSSINGELLLGIFKEETKNRFISIIDGLIAQGAEGVILGCTEIPLLIKQSDVSVPVINTLEIHASAAVKFALS